MTGLLLIGLGLLAVAGFYRAAISVTGPEQALSALLSLGFGGSLVWFSQGSAAASTPRRRMSGRSGW